MASDWLSRALYLPVPGNVLGMGILFTLIATGLVPLTWVEQGADVLLRHLSLLLIPAAAGVLRYADALRGDLLGISVIVVVTTPLIMLLTGWIAQALAQREGSPEADPEERR